MTPNFMDRTAKIIAEVRTVTFIDSYDVARIEEILQNELDKYREELNEYYEEEYHNAIASARSRAYDDGYGDGYDDGYKAGHFEKHSAVQ